MKVLVCGGRAYRDRDWVFEVLDALVAKRGPVGTLIHGAARGADSLAHAWGVERQVELIMAFPAQWDRHGKGAGHIRNRQMLDSTRPDLVVAFPGRNGTADMVKVSRMCGVETVEVPSR